ASGCAPGPAPRRRWRSPARRRCWRFGAPSQLVRQPERRSETARSTKERKMSGLLGTTADILNSPKVLRPTPFEERASEREFERFLTWAAAREREEQRELHEAEVNLLVRDSLEKLYRSYIEAKLTISANSQKQYVAACRKFHEFCQGDGGQR